MTDEDIDDLGIERQKLFARDLSGHPAEEIQALGNEVFNLKEVIVEDIY